MKVIDVDDLCLGRIDFFKTASAADDFAILRVASFEIVGPGALWGRSEFLQALSRKPAVYSDNNTQ